jgi:antitoxin (DNA-binding transcriptional repressor) of toxin-antitoxin stability system
MTTYSVADAKAGLPRLIDRALEGEEVVISRYGRPVAELRRLQPETRAGAVATYEWLRRRRAERLPVGVSSVALLDELHEEDRD